MRTIVFRLRHRFRERAPEWFCAANLFLWGATLLHPSETFVSPAFDGFRRYGEDFIGTAVAICGAIWLIGLIINGSMHTTTSVIRATCATFGALVYGLLALGFLYSFGLNSILSTGIGNYSSISVLALYSLYWIVRDGIAGNRKGAHPPQASD